MHIEIHRACGDDPVRDALAGLFERLVPLMSRLPGLAEVDADVRLTLGGEDRCHAWDVAPEALGFHAVISAPRNVGGEEDDEPVEDDDGEDRIYYEVNERHEAVVNLDAFEAAVGDWHGMSDGERAIEIESYLVTAAHELRHVAEWVRETKGATPDEVYAAGMGVVSVRMVHEAIEARLSALTGSGEDHVEEDARSLTAAALRPWIDEAVASMDAAMEPAPGPRA